MSTIKVGTLLAADGTTTTQPSIPALDKRMAKAWVNFNGSGTVAIRDDYGVSSITDNTTGTYTVNFSTAMNNANYIVTLVVGDDTLNATLHSGLITTGSYRIHVKNPSNAFTDTSLCVSSVFGS